MSGLVATGTYLDRILTQTAIDVAVRKASTPRQELERLLPRSRAPLSLATAIMTHQPAVIAEFKRASPSRGRFAFDATPATVAADYRTGGAAAISVLTDEPFFQGSLADLAEVAAVAQQEPSAVPVLRKDFIIDEYQLLESLVHGADAILLIVAALDDRTLTDLYRSATDLGLSVLVEIHDEADLRRALAIGVQILGINNRDLRTFEVTLETTERLAPEIPEGIIIVGESGIFTTEDHIRLRRVGVDAILVGESLITAPDRAAALRNLRHGVDNDI